MLQLLGERLVDEWAVKLLSELLESERAGKVCVSVLEGRRPKGRTGSRRGGGWSCLTSLQMAGRC